MVTISALCYYRYMSKLLGYAGYAAFGVALAAMLGSLLMSEILHWPPCRLCWYQRIFMYPLVFVIGIAIMRKDTLSWPITTLVLSGIGWIIALYHSLLQWKILPESMAACTSGVSCTTAEISWLGFITIPFMSLLAFTAIIALTVIYWRGTQNEQRI